MLLLARCHARDVGICKTLDLSGLVIRSLASFGLLRMSEIPFDLSIGFYDVVEFCAIVDGLLISLDPYCPQFVFFM